MLVRHTRNTNGPLLCLVGMQGYVRRKGWAPVELNPCIPDADCFIIISQCGLGAMVGRIAGHEYFVEEEKERLIPSRYIGY